MIEEREVFFVKVDGLKALFHVNLISLLAQQKIFPA